MSKVLLICHLVFGTKRHRRAIPFQNRGLLYTYITKTLVAHNCTLYCVNGFVDHVHVLFALHQSVALADLVRELKTESSKSFKGHDLFPDFEGWASGYYCHSLSLSDLDDAIQYVKNQETHHTIDCKEFMAELQWLILTHGMQWFEDEWN